MKRECRQGGTAAVELVLFLPVMLCMFWLTIYLAKAFQVRTEHAVLARTEAWKQESGLALSLGGVRYVDSRWAALGRIGIYGSDGDMDAQRLLLEAMRMAGPQCFDSNAIRTREADKEDVSATQVDTLSFYRLVPTDSLLDNLIPYRTLKDRHAVHMRTAWPSEAYPIGYDNFLKAHLRSGLLLPTVFPKSKVGYLDSMGGERGCL